MKIKILGCHGSQLPGFNLTSILINESFVLDAGSITSTLTLEQQKKIKNVLITHSHLDHIKDLAFLIDNIQFFTAPINLISSQEILDIIKAHFFNNKIWPDYTKLPDPGSPLLRYYPVAHGALTSIEELNVRIIKVNHIVPTVGCFISDEGATVMFTADTGPSEEIWDVANQEKKLKAVFVDVSFPNAMQGIAEKSRHLTPDMLRRELTKLRKSVDVYAYHLKSCFEKEIIKEIAKCCPQVKILKEGDVLNYHG